MKKILLTGATGFVGACLTRRLVELGHDVHVMIRAGSDSWRLAGLDGSLCEHVCDLLDQDRLERCVAAARPQVVFHLAACGGYIAGQDSRQTIAANFLGTVNLLRACCKTGFERFINTGSSSEYGIKESRMREDDLLEPRGDYAVSKAAATLFCRSEALEKGLPVLALRLFSPYGPRDAPVRLIPTVIRQYLADEHPRLCSPDAVRDYVFIDDVLECYLRLLEGPFPSGEVINVGSGRQSSVEEVAVMLGEIIGCDREPQWGMVAGRRTEPQTWVADIARAERLLGWRPATSLRQGLELTVAWMRDNLHHYQTVEPR